MKKFNFTKLSEKLPSTVPFVGPETQERVNNKLFAARLGANENVFGPSPLAIGAMKKEAEKIWMYGDPENHDLKLQLAKKHAVQSENIVVGEGIDGLLGYLCRLFIEPGDRVVSSLGAYPTFNFHVAGYGGHLDTVPYVNDYEDPESLVEKARETNAKLCYMANPDNPMGTWNSGEKIEKAINKIPDGCLFVLDEAYVEFAPQGTAPNIEIDNKKVIRFRTFSKAYGMAGARVGYAICHNELALAFNKIRNHFGMSRVSQAGALAALDDKPHLLQTIDNVNASKNRIYDIAKTNNLKAIPSATNFVAIDCGGGQERAVRIMKGLISNGIFVRMPFVEPQNRCIRISAGKPEDLDLLEQVLPKVLSKI
ncbi:MAG: pyridoxal phosphate-dependent aminotransferase [Paracoccaceae bacterium]|nr:pyridoxal phosphate-dependent aminotransferase [Paracoccaceae bacterium]